MFSLHLFTFLLYTFFLYLFIHKFFILQLTLAIKSLLYKIFYFRRLTRSHPKRSFFICTLNQEGILLSILHAFGYL